MPSQLVHGSPRRQSHAEPDVEEVRGLRITFKDLSYIVRNNANRKQELYLLKGLCGTLLPGQMCALMGPSGSGKTTLLDVLAGRKTVGRTQGEVLFAGVKPTKEFLRRYTGYVEQFDTLLPSLTVHEMLMYTAELKRPLKEPLAHKKEAVQQVLEALALEGCAGTKIGDPLHRGISGGQAKRVNIAISLVTRPRVLFLDEPTSGLDSYTSNEVMRFVKGLLREGITICATVHSPTAYTFSLFDRMLLLLRGQAIYFGDNGATAEAYFSSPAIPPVEGVEKVDSLVEWIVDLTTKGDRLGLVDEFVGAYNGSKLHAAVMEEMQAAPPVPSQLGPATAKAASEESGEGATSAGAMDGAAGPVADAAAASGGGAHLPGVQNAVNAATLEALRVKRATVTPTWWAFWTLLRYRTFKDYRDPKWLAPRVGDKVVFSIVIFSLWWGVGDTTNPAEYVSVAAILYMWVVLPAFGAAAYTVVIVQERPLFIRERNDGLYSVITYLAFKMFGEMSMATVTSAAASCWTWYALSLQGSWVIFWLAYMITLYCGIMLAYLMASICPSMDLANAALPIYTALLSFFIGYLIPVNQIPGYWIWFAYAFNPLLYAFGALMYNQFSNCCPEPAIGGQMVLEYYGLTGINPWVYLAIEFAFFLVFFLATWAALVFIRHDTR